MSIQAVDLASRNHHPVLAIVDFVQAAREKAGSAKSAADASGLQATLFNLKSIIGLQ